MTGISANSILILGATGNTGSRITELMLKRTESKITLAARNGERASRPMGGLVHRSLKAVSRPLRRGYETGSRRDKGK